MPQAGDCPVVILCGGRGTRLREETEHRPKAMVDVGGNPILWHVMRLFVRHGLREFVICLGYKGELIREYFSSDPAETGDVRLMLPAAGAGGLGGCTVTLVDTGQETATGGRVARVSSYLGQDRFALTYGDGVSNVDVQGLLAFHERHGRLATVTAVPAVSRFGVLELDGDDVSSFSEKPQLDDWISAGYFVFRRQVLERLDGDECVLEHGPLQTLAQEGELNAFRHRGFWQPMDTYREYELLNELWRSGAPWLESMSAEQRA
jgi:glucose-1-phosphate cytidylyltransferase